MTQSCNDEIVGGEVVLARHGLQTSPMQIHTDILSGHIVFSCKCGRLQGPSLQGALRIFIALSGT